MSRLVVTGADGMLGHAVLREAEAMGINIIGLTSRIPWGPAAEKPRGVYINCAGIVRGRDVPPVHMVKTNAYVPHFLATDPVVERLVHVSTDCVFSGRFQPYGHITEGAIPDPPDLYAKSKLAGEVDYGPHLTVRTSFVGIGKRGLLQWFLHQPEPVVEGWTNHFWNGLATQTLARVLIALALDATATGLCHVYSPDLISKFELLELFREYFRPGIEVRRHHKPVGINQGLTSWRDDIMAIWKPLAPPIRTQIRELARGFNNSHSSRPASGE